MTIPGTDSDMGARQREKRAQFTTMPLTQQQPLLATLVMLTKLLCDALQILSENLKVARLFCLFFISAIAVTVYVVSQYESLTAPLKTYVSLFSVATTYFPMSDARSLSRDKKALSLLRDRCQDNDDLNNIQLKTLIVRANKALDEFFRRRSQ